MKDWIKKNRDAIVVTAVGITAAAVVAGVSHKIAKEQINAISHTAMRDMSLIASDAGVLEKIIAHQEKLQSIVP